MFDPDKMLVFWQKGKAKNLSLDVMFALTPTDDAGGRSPMEMHNGNLSRFIFRLTDHASTPPAVLTYNLPSSDIPSLSEDYNHMLNQLQTHLDNENGNESDIESLKKMISDLVLKQHVSDEPECVSPENLSPAYTAIIPFGKFKGMTPASVLLENPNNKDVLIGTIQLLRKNEKTYENNKKVADAAEEAIKLLDEHKLVANIKIAESKPVASNEKLLYAPDGPRFGRNGTPDGYRIITGMEITCNFQNKYPWRITLTSCEAPMMKTAGGDALPELSKSRNHKSRSINLRKKDFSLLMDYILGRRRDFEITSFPVQYNKMKEEQRKNREEFRKKMQQQQNA